MEVCWVPSSFTQSAMLITFFPLCISILILLHWIGEKICNIRYTILSALYIHSIENTSCIYLPKNTFSQWFSCKYSMEHTLGNNYLSLPSSFFQVRKLRSSQMTLKATGVLIWTCMRFPLRLPLPASHRNEPPTVLQKHNRQLRFE